MAQNTSRDAQIVQNRKILLGEIHMQKQLLLKQGVAQSLSPALSVNPLPSTSSLDTNASQRQALLNAQANSAGYFISQESAFGNLILPVLPRFDVPSTK
ncbi:hypothetical protein TKK_0002021 [Trichogramma kaykai]|uniref:SOSS complex subunit C n=1 Tax=Trichogramma kaykai TaxID=54128 RepID=A0ABD2X8A6_9HYME